MEGVPTLLSRLQPGCPSRDDARNVWTAAADRSDPRHQHLPLSSTPGVGSCPRNHLCTAHDIRYAQPDGLSTYMCFVMHMWSYLATNDSAQRLWVCSMQFWRLSSSEHCRTAKRHGVQALNRRPWRLESPPNLRRSSCWEEA